MPDDETATMFTTLAHDATRDIEAPPSWTVTVPARAARRRQRIQLLGAVIAAGAAAAIVIPLTRAAIESAPPPARGNSTQLTAFSNALSQLPAVHDLPCRPTNSFPSTTGATFSLGATGPDGQDCTTLLVEEIPRLPSNARPVPGRGGRVYFGTTSGATQTGYARYTPKSSTTPVVLAVTVATAAPRSTFVDALASTVNSILPTPR